MFLNLLRALEIGLETLNFKGIFALYSTEHYLTVTSFAKQAQF